MDKVLEQVLIFVFGGGLVMLLDFFLKRRSNAMEVKRSEVDRLCVLVDQLQEDNERLRENLRGIEARERARDEARQQEIMGLRMGILILIDQLRSSGIEPKWTPGTGPLIEVEGRL